MTAQERTEKLLLEIAALHKVEPNRRQFSSLDFKHYLESSSLELTTEAIEATLHTLCQRGAMSWSVTDDVRYRITYYGEELLSDMQRAASALETA